MSGAEKVYDRLKEQMCQIEFVDTLYVIWGLNCFLQFRESVPRDIELPLGYGEGNYHPRMDLVTEWELDLLLALTIVYSAKFTGARYSLKNLDNFKSYLNSIRRLDNEIVPKITEVTGNFLEELFRLIHRQVAWQENTGYLCFYRHYKIFSHPDLQNEIKLKYNMTYEELLLCGLTVAGFFRKVFRSESTIYQNYTGRFRELIDIFVLKMSITVEEFQKRCDIQASINENFFYFFNPIKLFPLLKFYNNIFCPSPVLVHWRVTNGVYYDIVSNKKEFKRAIGNSFESYCGLVLKETITNKNISIYPEIVYGKTEKKTSDWILQQNNTLWLIECKAKRLKLGSKLKLADKKDIESDIEKMAGFVFQAYKSLNDVLGNKVDEIQTNSDTMVFVSILTFEEWFLALNPNYIQKIETKVREKCVNNNIDTSYIDIYPFNILSISFLENNSTLFNNYEISEVLTKLNENSLSDLKQNESKPLFLDDFERLKSDLLDICKST